MAIMKKSELYRQLHFASMKAFRSQRKLFKEGIEDILKEHPEDQELFDKIRSILDLFYVVNKDTQLVTMVEALSSIFDIESDMDLNNAETLKSIINPLIEQSTEQ